MNKALLFILSLVISFSLNNKSFAQSSSDELKKMQSLLKQDYYPEINMNYLKDVDTIIYSWSCFDLPNGKGGPYRDKISNTVDREIKEIFKTSPWLNVKQTIGDEIINENQALRLKFYISRNKNNQNISAYAISLQILQVSSKKPVYALPIYNIPYPFIANDGATFELGIREGVKFLISNLPRYLACANDHGDCHALGTISGIKK